MFRSDRSFLVLLFCSSVNCFNAVSIEVSDTGLALLLTDVVISLVACDGEVHADGDMDVCTYVVVDIALFCFVF